MTRPRNQGIAIESSWRMVEGEHDSFDTSIVPEDDDLLLSPGPSQFSPGGGGSSQDQFSQGRFSIGGSQDDDIQGFLDKAAEDEQVILRSPFQPSVPSSVRRQSPRGGRRASYSNYDNYDSVSMQNRSPEPEFYMPTVDIESPRRRTARPGDGMGSLRQRHQQQQQQQQQQMLDNGSPLKRSRPQQAWNGRQPSGPNYGRRGPAQAPSNLSERFAGSLPSAAFDVVAWLLGVVGLSFRYAQKPLAVLLAVYLSFGGLIIAQNMATRSIYTSLSPICRIPGAGWLDLPFCPRPVPGGGNGGSGAGNDNTPSGSSSSSSSSAAGGKRPIEFDGLMGVQEQFEEVLEKSASGVSLPMEMKRSEASIRDLRTLVRHSDLQGKEELVLEFDGFVETARTASNDLQKFNTHVGSAVDSVISINRWTSRYIDSLAQEQQHDASQSWLGGWAAWIFAPFQPTSSSSGAMFSERALLDKYVEHTALVSDRIGDLIVEAQAVLRALGRAEDHLGIIYDFVARTQRSVRSRRDEVLWTLWTLVGANTRRLHNLNEQLALLRHVDAQRVDAVRQVSELLVELEKIQAGLGDLRDRVAEPELVRASDSKIEIPLSVHIETINRGVERLEHARSRIRAIEDDRVRAVLARGRGPAEDRMIESA